MIKDKLVITFILCNTFIMVLEGASFIMEIPSHIQTCIKVEKIYLEWLITILRNTALPTTMT